MEETRILLRPLGKEDRDTVFAMTSDPQVAQYMRFDTHETPAQAEALIESYAAPGNFAYLVLDAGSGEAAGAAALKQSAEEGVFALSLFFARKYWGRGLSTAAVRELLKRGQRGGVKRVRGYVAAENAGSRRVLEKCGFTVGRVLRFDDLPGGLYVYALDFDGEMKETKG